MTASHLVGPGMAQLGSWFMAHLLPLTLRCHQTWLAGKKTPNPGIPFVDFCNTKPWLA